MLFAMLLGAALTGELPDGPEIKLPPPANPLQAPPPVYAPPAPPAKRDASDQSRPMRVSGNPGGWATNDDYPVRAMREEREGTVGFRLAIGVDGLPTDCEIISSSGHADLDAATCTLTSQRARFIPGLDASGKPTTGTYSNRIRWRIPDPVQASESFPRAPEPLFGDALTNPREADFPAGAVARALAGRVRVSLDIGKDGAIRACKATALIAPKPLVAASCPYITPRARFSPALGVDGQPTDGRYATTLVWQQGAVTPDSNLRRTRPRLDPGGFSLSFVVGADGNVRNCKQEKTGSVPFGEPPSDLCLNLDKVDPYQDAQGNPVDRQVTISFAVGVAPLDESVPR